MLNDLIIDEAWEEYESEAHRVKASAIASLTAQLEKRRKYEAEQAELEQLKQLLNKHKKTVKAQTPVTLPSAKKLSGEG